MPPRNRRSRGPNPSPKPTLPRPETDALSAAKARPAVGLSHESLRSSASSRLSKDSLRLSAGSSNPSLLGSGGRPVDASAEIDFQLTADQTTAAEELQSEIRPGGGAAGAAAPAASHIGQREPPTGRDASSPALEAAAPLTASALRNADLARANSSGASSMFDLYNAGRESFRDFCDQTVTRPAVTAMSISMASGRSLDANEVMLAALRAESEAAGNDDVGGNGEAAEGAAHRVLEENAAAVSFAGHAEGRGDEPAPPATEIRGERSRSPRVPA